MNICKSIFLSHQSNQLDTEIEVMVDFVASPWYSDIVYVLQNLQAPEGLSKSRARAVKLNFAKFCIINKYLYWKDPGGVLLNCLLEDNKRSWHTKLKYALWADRISTKRAIGMSPFQLVYGTKVIFPASLGVPVMR